MTINSATRKAGPFLGDGVTTTFPFAFKIFSKADVQVTLTNPYGVETALVLDSDYSVALNSDQSVSPGGVITYPIAGSPAALGYKLTLTGGLPNLQPTSLPNNGPWYPKTVEDAFDRAVILIQQLAEKVSRSLRFALSDTSGAAAELPGAAARVNNLLGFDLSGNVALYPITASVGAGNLTIEGPFVAGTDFTPGTTTTLPLSQAYSAKSNVQVHFDGVYQGPDQYNLNANQIVFTSPIPVGVGKVYIIGGTTLSIYVPAAGSVGDPQLGWGTVLGRVVSSRAELQGLDTGKYKRAFVIGFASAGDRGGLGPVYFNPSSIAVDNGGSVTAPNSGYGRWLMQNPDVLNPFMFGAKGDKVTDDTAAIQACYNAVPIGGTFRLPVAPGLAYIVSTQPGGYCLDFSRFVHIEAEGFFSALQPAAGTTSNTVRLKPVVGGGYWGMKWEGLTLGDPFTGTRAGLNGIFIDTQVDGSQLPAGIFRNLNVMTGSVVGGVGILHINSSVGANINGGMYGTSFEDCIVKGGFNLQGSGDSNVIKRALISGPNVGVYFSLTAGASLLTLEDCNITSTGGAVLADSGSRFKMYHCNCEQIQPFTQSITGFTTDCMVNVRGSNGTMSTPEIVGNHFGLFYGVPNSAVVRINNVIGGKADGNVLLNSNSAPTGFIVSNSTNFRIGDGNTYGTAIVTTGAKVSDTGTGTMGVYKPLASTLINAWSQSPVSPTATFVSFKTCAGEVIVDGKLSGGTVTSGTAFAMLPAGHAPLETREFPVVTYNGATLVPGHVRIETDGTMRIMSGQNTAMYLSGIRFMAADLADATSDL